MAATRIFEALEPQKGMKTMVEVLNYHEEAGVCVSLLEWNGIKGTIRLVDSSPTKRHLLITVGRILPAEVTRVGRDGIFLKFTEPRDRETELRFNRILHIQSIFGRVANDLDLDLEDLNKTMGWPCHEALTEEDYNALTDASTVLGAISGFLSPVVREKLLESVTTMVLRSWRIINPLVLRLSTLVQNLGYCWAVVIVKQLESLLKIRGILAMDEELSIQYLINSLNPIHYNIKVNGKPTPGDGSIRSTETGARALKKFGVTLERLCPTDFIRQARTEIIPLYKPSKITVKPERDNDAPSFVYAIEKALFQKPRTPIMVGVLWFPSYNDNLDSKAMFEPTVAEWSEYEKNPLAPEQGVHIMFSTGDGKDENGTHFWEMQESYGDLLGDRGFVRFCKFPNLIIEYVVMES